MGIRFYIMTDNKRQKSNMPRSPAKHAWLPLDHARPTAEHRLPGKPVDIIAITLLALVPRIVFFFFNKQNNPLFFHPIMDALYHDEWARKIISGEFWGSDVFFRAPLYPYLLAFLYKLSGSSIAVAVFVQHILGAASAALTYMLGRLYFRRSVALTAGCLAALYWPFIYFEGQLLIVTLAIFLDLCCLIALTLSLFDPRRRFPVVAGLFLGLSAIARPSVLILVPALPFIYYFGGRQRKRGGDWKRSVLARALIPAAFVCAGAMVFIGPVLIRNYAVGYDIVPIASQGGVNFYIGNNPQSDGRTAIVPGTRPDWWGGYYDAIEMAEKDEGRPLQPSEVSNYFFKRGLSFMLHSPAEAARLMAHKFRLFWSGGERANNMNIYFFWRITGMGAVPLPGFWLVCPLGLLGLTLAWRKRRELVLFYLFVAAYSAGVIAFFVNARFRLPVVPVLILFAAAALVSLVNLFRENPKRFAAALALLALFAFAVNIDFATFKENTVYAEAFSRYSLGNAYLKMDRKDLALKEYRTAYEQIERYPVSSYELIERNVNYNLGTLYREQGECEKAIQHLSRVGGSDSFAVGAKRQLADCYRKEGMPQRALQAYQEALTLDQNDYRSLLGLSELLIEMNDRAAARRVLQHASRLYPNDPRINGLLDSAQ